MHFKILLALAAFAALLTLAGIVAMWRRPDYDITTANRTHYELDDVWVFYGTKIAAAPGRLVPGGQKSYGPIGLPVPEEATVTWRDQNGIQHSPKARLAGIVPRAPRVQKIWLVVEEDGTITVRMVRHDDIEANADMIRSLKPYREKDRK